MISKQTYLQSARVFAKMMDNQFSFLGIKFGVENIIGLFPGIGDILSLVFSFYLVWIGRQIGLPKEKISKMISNIVIDAIFGSIPLAGDIFDLFYKANMKNLQILESYESVIEGKIISKD